MKYLKDAFELLIFIVFTLFVLTFPFLLFAGISAIWTILPIFGKIGIVLLGVYLIILEMVIVVNIDEIFGKWEDNNETKS